MFGPTRCQSPIAESSTLQKLLINLHLSLYVWFWNLFAVVPKCIDVDFPTILHGCPSSMWLPRQPCNFENVILYQFIARCAFSPLTIYTTSLKVTDDRLHYVSMLSIFCLVKTQYFSYWFLQVEPLSLLWLLMTCPSLLCVKVFVDQRCMFPSHRKAAHLAIFLSLMISDVHGYCSYTFVVHMLKISCFTCFYNVSLLHTLFIYI